MAKQQARTTIWAVVAALGPMAVAIGSRDPISDNSYLWHRVAGAIQAQAGRVLTEDPFSFTALNSPWRTQSWLADLLYQRLFLWGGVDSARWIPVVVGTVLFAFLAVTARERIGTGVGYALFMATSVLIMLPFMNPRPVIFSYVFLSAMVLAAERKRLLWSAPLVMWIWASVHGSFPLGFVVLGSAFLRKPSKRTAVVAASSLAVVNTTAHGWGVWNVLAAFASSTSALDLIHEWQTPDFASIPLAAFPVGLFFAARAWKLGSVSGWRSFEIVAWSVFAATSARAVPLAWIAMTPTIAEGMSALRFGEKRRTIDRRMAAVAVCALIVVPLAVVPAERGLDQGRFPQELTRQITAQRVYASDAIGALIIHERWPDLLVYVDDRAELYGDQFETFAETSSGVGDWRGEFDRYDMTEAIVETDGALHDLLTLEGWQPIDSAEEFTLLAAPN